MTPTHPTLTTILALAAVLASAAVIADEAHEGHQHHRQHDPHAHGIGNLDLALEGREVHLGLDSPAANLIGFEHAPATEVEKQTLAQALELLKDGEKLFRFPPAAECRLVQAGVETPLATHAGPESEAAGGDEHGHDGHDEPGQEAHHEDEARNAAERHAGEVHADIAAEYRFTCAHPELLSGLEVMLFQAFPGTERLRVQYVTPAGQGGVDLTPSNPSIAF